MPDSGSRWQASRAGTPRRGWSMHLSAHQGARKQLKIYTSEVVLRRAKIADQDKIISIIFDNILKKSRRLLQLPRERRAMQDCGRNQPANSPATPTNDSLCLGQPRYRDRDSAAIHSGLGSASLTPPLHPSHAFSMPTKCIRNAFLMVSLLLTAPQSCTTVAQTPAFVVV